MKGKKLLVLTGAGMSAESGISTFRDSNGLWENHRIEDVASISAWHRNPQLVIDFYNLRRRNILNAQPNAAHIQLAGLEQDVEVRIITQNIDDLHERAGSTQVLHLHGEITMLRSERNAQVLVPYNQDLNLGDLAPDGAQLRPHIVWFGEAVPQMEVAIDWLHHWADMLLVIGTSLQVYPAAGLVSMAAASMPKFIIDKHLPEPLPKNIISFECSATQGLPLFMEHLKKA